MESHLITLMILFPFLGAILQAFQKQFSRWIALGCSLISSLVGLFLIFDMTPHQSLIQAYEQFPWIGSYAISYEVGIDGLNALLILLSAIVFPLLLISEWSAKKNQRGLHGLFLLLQAATVGACCAQDLFLLFFFWALTTLPFYFLLVVWGEKDRESAAFRYLVMSAIGNMLFFSSMLLVYFSVEPHTFSIQELMGGRVGQSPITILGWSASISKVAFVLLFLGMLFRLPFWPTHGWFNFFVTQAPASVSVAFCGILVPLGVYIFFRLSYSLFPSEALSFSNVLIAVGGLNIFFGALGAVAQKELKRLLSYLCMTHVGFLLMGIASLDSAGVVGAVYQQLVMGLGLAGFGLFVGLIQDRTNSSVFLEEDGTSVLGGVARSTPTLALITGVLVASLLGVPGLGGFVGQSLILMGSYTIHPTIVLLIGAGMIFLTYGLFTAYRQVFLGFSEGKEKKISDLSIRERGFLYPIIFIILFLGVYPKPLLDLVRPSVLEILSGVK